MATKKVITWEEFDADVRFLAKRLRSIKLIAKNIYGVPRGGMVAAVMLSHQMGLPIITQQRLISKETIVVDDIIDTGGTIQRVLEKKKPLAVVSVWYHPQSKYKPDFYVKVKKDWLVFPFEKLSSSKYDRTV